MKLVVEGLERRLKGWARVGMIAGLLATPVMVAEQAEAQTQRLQQSRSLVIGNDRGGLLINRLRQLAKLRQSRTSVEIRGSVCFSTCTMYLGLPGTCISPNTTFGFHGPSSYGRPLDPETFERASKVISRYYPPALRNWYMSKARYQLRQISRISGAQIIQMGVREC